MSFLDTLKHLVEHGQVFASDTEKAEHLAELEAARELDSVLPRLKAVEDRLTALEARTSYQPAHALGPDQDPEVATSPPATPPVGYAFEAPFHTNTSADKTLPPSVQS